MKTFQSCRSLSLIKTIQAGPSFTTTNQDEPVDNWPCNPWHWSHLTELYIALLNSHHDTHWQGIAWSEFFKSRALLTKSNLIDEEQQKLILPWQSCRSLDRTSQHIRLITLTEMPSTRHTQEISYHHVGNDLALPLGYNIIFNSYV